MSKKTADRNPESISRKALTQMLPLAALLLLLGACTPYIHLTTIPEGYEDLERCEIRDVSVDQLASIGEPGCDLQGSTVVFPDGYRFSVGTVQEGAFLETRHDSDGKFQVGYSVTNHGIPGIGASHRLPGADTQYWATSDLSLELITQSDRPGQWVIGG